MAEKKSKKDSGAWDEYESPSQEALRKAQDRVKEGKGGFTGKPYLDPSYKLYITQDGDNQIRIVPPIEVRDLGMFGRDIFIHRGVGPNREIYVCLKKMWGEACPRCMKQTPELWEQAKVDEKVKDIAKSYFPEYKVLVWVIDRKADSDELKLFPMPKTIAEEILVQSNRKETQVMIDVAHPTQGRDVYFTRYKDNDYTKYKGIQIGETATPLPSWAAEQRKHFDEVIIKPDFDEFAEAEAMTSRQNQSSEDAAEAPKVTEQDDGKDELDRLDLAGLKKLIKDLKLEIKFRKDWEEDDYRTAIRKEISPESGEDGGADEAESDDQRPLPEDIADCYGVDFDEYEECDSCPEYWRTKCKDVCAQKASEESDKQSAANKGKASTREEQDDGKGGSTAKPAVDRDAIMAKIKERMGK